MKFFRDYGKLIIFCSGILLGVQIPNFIDQYVKRISAHHIEAKTNFSGYQDTADKHFEGNVQMLITHYESSQDKVFQDDAKNIKRIYYRILDFEAELKALNASLLKKICHVVFHSNPDVLEETFSEYSSMVPLNQAAIICGLALALVASLAFELILFALAKIFSLIRIRFPIQRKNG
ncbi:MAG: DUF2937 family protein [Desulfobacterales bacterium]|nr:DUF2937 family protein [Desulfobacterales bacterium]